MPRRFVPDNSLDRLSPGDRDLGSNQQVVALRSCQGAKSPSLQGEIGARQTLAQYVKLLQDCRRGPLGPRGEAMNHRASWSPVRWGARGEPTAWSNNSGELR